MDGHACPNRVQPRRPDRDARAVDRQRPPRIRGCRHLVRLCWRFRGQRNRPQPHRSPSRPRRRHFMRHACPGLRQRWPSIPRMSHRHRQRCPKKAQHRRLEPQRWRLEPQRRHCNAAGAKQKRACTARILSRLHASRTPEAPKPRRRSRTPQKRGQSHLYCRVMHGLTSSTTSGPEARRGGRSVKHAIAAIAGQSAIMDWSRFPSSPRQCHSARVSRPLLTHVLARILPQMRAQPVCEVGFGQAAFGQGEVHGIQLQIGGL
jgi:hypothetical protein